MIRNEERSGLVFTIAGGAILLVVLLGLLGFFHEPQHAATGAAHAAPRRLGSVAGEIVDARSGRAIADTNLDVSGLDGVSDHWREPPDPELPRRFELKGLPADRDFTLEISAPGHVSERREARVAAGATTELGEIRLVPLVSLIGTVVDANFQPVADADLALSREGAPPGPEGATTRRADAHGSFRVDSLDPGIWSITARTASGERCDRPATVDARGGGEAPPVEIELFPTGSLRGRLKLPIGALAATEVRAGASSAAVAGDGSFAVDGLFAGPHRLSFRFGETWRTSDPIFVPNDALELDATRLVDATGPEPEFHFGIINAGAGAGAGAGEDSRAGSCVFVVRVVDEAARPLAGALVRLVFDDAADLMRATARNGETTFRAIAAGPASAIVARSGARRSFDTRPVVITERTSGAPFELHCVPIHSLVVKVVTPAGVPVARPHVVVGAVRSEGDDAGVARFAELPPPPWSIEVDGSDGFEAWSSPNVAPEGDGTVTVKLAAKGAAKGDAKNDVR